MAGLWHLLNIPSEIRNQIWILAFGDQHAVRSTDEKKFLKDDCQACQANVHTYVDLSTWDEIFRPLLTCKQIFNEARQILCSSFTLHLGTSPFQQKRAAVDKEVRRIELWMHIKDDNRLETGSTMKLIGLGFPNLRQLTVHAHMRPPDSYESLCDAVSLAAAIVRLGRDRRETEVALDFDYVRHGVMFHSPHLGEIRTEDSLEEHELVVRDLIEDDAFIEAVLADDDDGDADEQAMTAALLRVARSHEQSWFERLQRRRRDHMTEGNQAGLEASASTSST
ncbi:hypothetical protein A1O1_03240 [Capronia coronata CBS 617.96]|uniref:Uncharacterized protein n=1 Tax=Capronia coronata CBS 617.96 TaxID=1182541 RepID=W9YPM5_9EURO|nr:uncharacterized protein A1O1_03240 [Capronia coronata CBS 617.96]EXJ94842.1 hypothetical protein A1O1_03240 [Capronia coronata CBS 617.96]